MGLLKELPEPPKGKTGWPWTAESDAGQFEKHDSWPLFTIITPSFNHGEFIEETIRSILLQNHPNLEYIIMDGGSTDHTHEIIEKYRPWITVFRSEKDDGQSDAINKGIDLATGELINWMNSDDYLLPDALFEVGNYFLEHPDVSLIYGNALSIYPGKGVIPYEAAEYDLYDFISRISIHQPCTFWKRKLFDKVGKLDQSLNICMDYDFWMRVMFDIQHDKLPVRLSAFRRYADSKSSNFEDQSEVFREYRIVISRLLLTIAPDYIGQLRSLDLYYNEAGVTYPIDRRFDPETIKNIVDTYILQCGLQEYTAGNRKEANRILKNCLGAKTRNKALFFLAKNNLRVRKFFHPYRKS